MQLELSLLLREMNVTTILVTHDQREAFALADRVAIMESGRIAQIGTPETIYRDPTSSSVLRFLGTTNRLRGRISSTAAGPQIQIRDSIVFHLPSTAEAATSQSYVWIDIRAEDITIFDRPTSVHTTNPATVVLRTFLGSQERFVLKIVDRPCQANRNEVRLGPGDRVYLDFDPSACRFAFVR
jgi:ABC-type Fe3+/spermidine/putrescine transport system ATPase subunit